MSDAAHAEHLRPAQEQLGTLLVERGLITAEQLEIALVDQKASGEPLGRIVVERGYVRPEVVAQALATQHGGLFKSEYGFATGFGPSEEAPAMGSQPAQEAKPENRIELLEAAVANRDAAIAEFGRKVESWKSALDERDEMIRGLVAHRDMTSRELEERAGRLSEVQTELDRVRTKLTAVGEAHGKREWELAKLAAERDEAHADLLAARTALDAIETETAHRAAEHEHALDQLADLRAEAETTRWLDATSHLLFFRADPGYELAVRSGPPPGAGELVEVPGGARRVVRVAAGPLPGGSPCAYLDAL